MSRPTVPRQRAIYKIWPDFPVEALIDRSTTTVKADAALRAYDATGEQIVWAVIDSGINGKHIHFGAGQNPQNTATRSTTPRSRNCIAISRLEFPTRQHSRIIPRVMRRPWSRTSTPL